MIIGDSISLLNQIGSGSYGSVFFGFDKNTKESFAVKKISKEILLNPTVKTHINNEIYILRNLPHHPNIIKFNSVIESLTNVYIVMEYCNGGSLLKALNKQIQFYKTPFNEETTRYIVKNIANGLLCINQHNIIHRDIKAENILLHYPNKEDLITGNIIKAEIKIIDFGFSRYLEENELASTIIGTPLFMDPKILSCGTNATSTKGDSKETKKVSQKTFHYDFKADIWSLGIITYNLLFGILPFKGANWDELFHSINDRKFCLPEKREDIILSMGAIKFIDKMLNIDSNLRPSAEELMNEPWIKGIINSEDKVKMIMKDDKELQEMGNDCLSFSSYWKILEENAHPQFPNQESKYKHLRINSLIGRITRKQIWGNENKTKIKNNEIKMVNYISPNKFLPKNINDPGTPIKEENHIKKVISTGM